MRLRRDVERDPPAGVDIGPSEDLSPDVVRDDEPGLEAREGVVEGAGGADPHATRHVRRMPTDLERRRIPTGRSGDGQQYSGAHGARAFQTASDRDLRSEGKTSHGAPFGEVRG